MTPTRSKWLRRSAATLACLALAGQVQAFTVTSVSPQGEVRQANQVVVKFSEDVTRFGDPQAQAPFSVSCDGLAQDPGQDRWISSREWSHDFAADLPTGVRCEIRATAGFQSKSGSTLEGPQSYHFDTGGPRIDMLRPDWGRIDEEQIFVLKLSSPARPDTVLDHVHCEADDLGEVIPVRRIEGDARAQLLEEFELEDLAQEDPDRVHMLQCKRRLSPDTEVALRYGPGVQAPNGLAVDKADTYRFKVRKPFEFETSCERENAESGCLPVKPIRVRLSAPTPLQALSQVRLEDPETGTEYPPLLPEADELDDPGFASSLQFKGPFPAGATLQLHLPADLEDDIGRKLVNADQLPLSVRIGPEPILAKFASGRFGIIERFAEGPDGPALLPLTLRATDPEDDQSSLTIRQISPTSDAEIIRWLGKVRYYNQGQGSISRERAERDLPKPPPPKTGPDDERWLEARRLSLLDGATGVSSLNLDPPKDGSRPFEVVGLPLEPGFHVLEVQSGRLGQTLLKPEYGPDRKMYVRTAALVTNLGVHFKLGGKNSLAWVTTLDEGRPVAGAEVNVSSCSGKLLATAHTDANGLASFPDLSPDEPSCNDYYSRGYFVSARVDDAGQQDLAFTWSSWTDGIEPWRFGVPTAYFDGPLVAHTIFDRSLLRAGETVSMKHLLRAETEKGLEIPENLPLQLIITHVGSGQEFKQELDWRSTDTGGLSAESHFDIPQDAKLGEYEVSLRGRDAENQPQEFFSGSFRVEEFRLPVFAGKVAPTSGEALVGAGEIPVQVQVNYINGGAAAQLPVQVSAVLEKTTPRFAGYGDYEFSAPEEEDEESTPSRLVVADKLPLVLDAQGLGEATIQPGPDSPQPRRLTLEASYADPNGELQTLSHSRMLWPAAVAVGIKSEYWVSTQRRDNIKVVALDPDGRPVAGTPLRVQARQHQLITSRKRMVGGFYTYDSKREVKDLGEICSGTSDAKGLLTCKLGQVPPGRIELLATGEDEEGRPAQASMDVWVIGKDEIWFGGRDDDRMDVLPEKKRYEAGETARLQVRMPFREATALVTVEREGILSQQIMQLSGQDPTIEIRIDEDWAPNAYITVLALRGRVHETPWYSFFQWGYKTPSDWWQDYRAGKRRKLQASSLVDLSKPAFRLGMAELQIGTAGHELKVEVKAEQPRYQIRERAKVHVRVTQPDGQPAAGAEVAVAAVDQALLELKPNDSWKLLEAMFRRRPWSVKTATAQMEIVGRRHYGRKAIAAGGGGGQATARELLDTLLLWEPRLKLDENGETELEVPLNDALSTFQIVAVADAGADLFGTGQTSIRTTQDLQIISGLPPLVREGDDFRAMLTLRNSTEQPMEVRLSADVADQDLKLEPITAEIPAGSARDVHWDLTAPLQDARSEQGELHWTLSAEALDGSAHDALKFTQRIVPAFPLEVWQATLQQIDGNFQLDVAPPADALPASGAKRGGLKMSFQPRLATGLPAIHDWFADYPYTCLEQLTSKAIGMDDEALWQQQMKRLRAHMDEDGLLYYFPPRAYVSRRGSDILTARLLSGADEAQKLHPQFQLPSDEEKEMLQGLADFVTGRIQRSFWSPLEDLTVRKLAAMDALSRYGGVTPDMVSSLNIDPNAWPTSAVIDWVGILDRVDGIPEAAAKREQAMQILRARLSTHGTRMIFNTAESDAWWWLMAGGDVDAARLLLLVMDDPGWRDDVGRLVAGFIHRQKGGAWNTTIANLWGKLALEQFSAKFESEEVAGFTMAELDGAQDALDWAGVEQRDPDETMGRWHGAPSSPEQFRNNDLFLPWPAAGEGELSVRHLGSGKPWMTLQSVAAVQLKAPFSAGYQIRKTVRAIEQADPELPEGQYSRGDILRVTLEVTAASDMTWVAITDPIPTGATILGSGLGRDSSIATAGEERKGWGWLAFEERSFEAFRSYYEYLPKGKVKMEYTVRLNNPGNFQLPPSRVEALYAPEMLGVAPNAGVQVRP